MKSIHFLYSMMYGLCLFLSAFDGISEFPFLGLSANVGVLGFGILTCSPW